jgi:hypothetical protein
MKESSAEVGVEEQIIELDVSTRRKSLLSDRLRLTGGAQPIFLKQLRFSLLIQLHVYTVKF